MRGLRLGALGIALGFAGCKAKPSEPKPSTVAQGQTSSERRPPTGDFRIDYDLRPTSAAAAPSPPAAALVPWRVWLSQERPRQKKNPHWRVVAAQSGAELELAPGGHYRCVLTPVVLHAHQESPTEVKHWTATRNVRCSSDEWRTFAETRLIVSVGPLGEVALPPDPRPSLLLHDVAAGEDRETVVALTFGADDSARDAGVADARATNAGPEDAAAKDAGAH